jgi:hypothetical protein
MNIKILSIAALAFIGVSVSAHAQSKFAGRYDLLSGYSTGQAAGLFGYGIATIARNGNASYSAYFPFLGSTGYGSGRINSRGVFSLNNGTSGSATLMGNRVAVGNFWDGLGTGYFGLRKK